MLYCQILPATVVLINRVAVLLRRDRRGEPNVGSASATSSKSPCWPRCKDARTGRVSRSGTDCGAGDGQRDRWMCARKVNTLELPTTGLHKLAFVPQDPIKIQDLQGGTRA